MVLIYSSFSPHKKIGRASVLMDKWGCSLNYFICGLFHLDITLNLKALTFFETSAIRLKQWNYFFFFETVELKTLVYIVSLFK